MPLNLEPGWNQACLPTTNTCVKLRFDHFFVVHLYAIPVACIEYWFGHGSLLVSALDHTNHTNLDNLAQFCQLLAVLPRFAPFMTSHPPLPCFKSDAKTILIAGREVR